MKIIVNDSKAMICRDFYIFLFILIKSIFIKRQKTVTEIEKKINDIIETINTNIIKEKEKYISRDYSINNFNNIFDFIKNQNKIFSGEIIEGVLIHVFSLAFQSDKDNTIPKFIFSNLFRIRDPNYKFEIIEMFLKEKFYPEELKAIINNNNRADNDIIYDRITLEQKNCVFFNLLTRVFLEKYSNVRNLKKENKSMYYINRGISDNQKISEAIFNDLKDKASTILDKDIAYNSIMSILSNMFFLGQYEEVIHLPIRIIRGFLTQVFIYSQNKNSPLMNFILKEDDHDEMPFAYDLRGACVEGRYSFIILAPLRLEPRINRILLNQNNLRESGLYEIGKNIIFNKNIKNIDCNTSLIRTNYIDFFNSGLGLFDTSSVEVLNFSFNYIKDNSEEFIARLITHFQGLKTINLTNNELRRGLASFLVVLKKLYRQGKTKLENLIVNKCLLDEATYYELGELLKCKYCKLKKLFLNFNTMPSNINFLKKLKKNRSLTEIYINKNDISSNDADDISRIISNTNVRYLYLYKNQISNFNELLNILYRSKLIKDKDEIIGDESDLTNLDVSNNDLLLKNKYQIILLTDLVKETTLHCLDISHIIYGPNPDKKSVNNDNLNYRKKVEELSTYLDNKKKEYIKTIKEIRINEVELNRAKKFIQNEKLINDLDDLKLNTNEILAHKSARQTVYLLEQSEKIIKDENYKDKIDKILDKEEYKDLKNKKILKILENYFIVKRAQQKLPVLEEVKNSKKLIII